MNQAAFPLTANRDEEDDLDLVRAAGSGDAMALDQLVRRHQSWIYNLALRFLLNPDDAADLTQEVLIRIITRLGQFQGRSSFRTWAYRIVMHAFLDGKKGKLERQIKNFALFGAELDELPNTPLNLPRGFQPERRLLVEEAKIGCMLGMLLCLSREQRLTYILGEIFEVPSQIGGEVFDIPAATFRKRLARARADLVNFMNDKCGLINQDNPCRCEKKTSAFMKAGWLDPQRLKFADHTLQALREVAPRAAVKLKDLTAEKYASLFRDHPFYEGPDLARRLRVMLEDPEIRATFLLDPSGDED